MIVALKAEEKKAERKDYSDLYTKSHSRALWLFTLTIIVNIFSLSINWESYVVLNEASSLSFEKSLPVIIYGAGIYNLVVYYIEWHIDARSHLYGAKENLDIISDNIAESRMVIEEVVGSIEETQEPLEYSRMANFIPYHKQVLESFYSMLPEVKGITDLDKITHEAITALSNFEGSLSNVSASNKGIVQNEELNDL